MNIEVAQATHSGRKREVNEDAVGVFGVVGGRSRGPSPPLLMVADGMGGHRAGNLASRQAIKVTRQTFYRAIKQQSPAEALRQAIRQANDDLRKKGARDSALQGMGTTVVAATLEEERIIIGNVGDSRAYLVRGEDIRQLTEDHSAVAEQQRRGEEAVTTNRNVITRAVGRREDLAVDTFTYEWKPGDALLLCSDGLWGQVSDAQIAAVVSELTPEDAVGKLIEMAMIAQAPDNISVVIARKAGQS